MVGSNTKLIQIITSILFMNNIKVVVVSVPPSQNLSTMSTRIVLGPRVNIPTKHFNFSEMFKIVQDCHICRNIEPCLRYEMLALDMFLYVTTGIASG